LLAASVAARFALSSWLEPLPFLTFFPAIVASTLLCGWRQGALVLMLSALVARYFWLTPYQSFALTDANTVIQLLGFLAVGALDVLIVAGLVEVIRRLDRATKVQDSLFNELRHRVANNMQIVASMLHIARRDISDIPAREMLDDAAARIASMAHLNRRIYDRATYATGLQPILRDVLAETFRDLPVDVRLDIRPDNLSLDHMTAILLLVNEAAINAAKHVFRPERGTLFEVSLSEVANERLQLLVRDDGPGLGPVASAGRQTQTLGMTIMRAFAGQLGGSLEVLEGPGTALRVQFAPR
jgi:two-component sensor histidine kinase